MSEIARLVEPILSGLAFQARRLDLNGDTLAIEPILNWGGFVNRSFRVSDGRRSLFLKLTSYADAREGLEVWRRNASLLESRYHAPGMVGWLDLPHLNVSGPMFRWIEGRTPARITDRLAGEIGSVIEALHRDEQLAGRLPGPVHDCAEAYRRSYHERFTEDLEFVAASPPPFVDAALLAWIRSRVSRLEARVNELPAFREPAGCPIHGDLWINNVWLEGADRWYLLDWDGVCLGDPVIDWTMLFGPTRSDPRATTEGEVLKYVRLSDLERERLSVYAEASQLDWLLDPLSDWVGSENEPEHGPAMRQANARVHAQALLNYRTRYGSD